jgi:hypothetical protein
MARDSKPLHAALARLGVDPVRDAAAYKLRTVQLYEQHMKKRRLAPTKMVLGVWAKTNVKMYLVGFRAKTGAFQPQELFHNRRMAEQHREVLSASAPPGQTVAVFHNARTPRVVWLLLPPPGGKAHFVWGAHRAD